MAAKTLKEICDSAQVTRRALQGYEKAGLVCASGKNKYGHLLYDEAAEARIALIRFYQQIGFSIRDISALIDAPVAAKKDALQAKLLELNRKCEKDRALIEKTRALLDSLL